MFPLCNSPLIKSGSFIRLVLFCFLLNYFLLSLAFRKVLTSSCIISCTAVHTMYFYVIWYHLIFKDYTVAYCKENCVSWIIFCIFIYILLYANFLSNPSWNEHIYQQNKKEWRDSYFKTLKELKELLYRPIDLLLDFYPMAWKGIFMIF